MRSALPPEYLEAVRSMSSSTMNRACEILLQPEVINEDNDDKTSDDKGSADEILAMYHKCQSAFAIIQKHQPRLAPNLAPPTLGGLKAGTMNNPNTSVVHLPMRKKSMLSAVGGGSNSGTISAKHGIMRSKKSLVPHGRRTLNDAISSDSPLAKKARLHGSNIASNSSAGGKSTTTSEAPPKSALNFLNKLNRGGNSSSSSGDGNGSTGASTFSSEKSSVRNQPPRSTSTSSASSTTRNQPSREARNAPSSTPPTRSQPSREARNASPPTTISSRSQRASRRSSSSS